MTVPRYHTYPKEWGMQLHYTGKPIPLKDRDLETLGKLRELFEERQGGILTWKFDLKPLIQQKDFKGIVFVLKRLWVNGYVAKFTPQFHTVHGSAEYIKWFIWEETTDDSDAKRGDTRAPGYIVQR